MRAQVVYESQFGNVERIARTIAAEFGVVANEISADGPEPRKGVDLLIVGAPTHMFTMSTRFTRRLSQRSGGRGGRGMREWLASVPLEDVGAVAVFDTQSSRISGSATRSASRFLHRRGVPVVARAEFLVSAQAGPLAAGEIERAQEWARKIATDTLKPRSR